MIFNIEAKVKIARLLSYANVFEVTCKLVFLQVFGACLDVLKLVWI